MLLSLDTLKTHRNIPKILFVFDPMRRHEFFQIDNHRTNYGAFEPINAALHSFNEITNLFDFNKSRSQFVAQVKSYSQPG
jgi:hypothetical protein